MSSGSRKSSLTIFCVRTPTGHWSTKNQFLAQTARPVTIITPTEPERQISRPGGPGHWREPISITRIGIRLRQHWTGRRNRGRKPPLSQLF